MSDTIDYWVKAHRRDCPFHPAYFKEWGEDPQTGDLFTLKPSGLGLDDCDCPTEKRTQTVAEFLERMGRRPAVTRAKKKGEQK